MTHGDDFVITGPTDRLADLKNKIVGRVSNQNKNHQSRVNSEHQSTKQEFAMKKERGVVYQHDARHVDVLVKDLGKSTWQVSADSSSA